MNNWLAFGLVKRIFFLVFFFSFFKRFNGSIAERRISVRTKRLPRFVQLICHFLYKGNFVTFAWWDELWLETALADYIKYRAVDEAYPEWNIVKKIYFLTKKNFL